MNDNLESIDKSDKKREQYKETKLVAKIQPLHLLENQKKKQNTMKKQLVEQQIECAIMCYDAYDI